MKILVSDKISAYYRYVELHGQLFECQGKEECTQVSDSLIQDWLENQLIHKELNYYKDHGKVLGEHPIFERVKVLREIDGLTADKLVKKINALYKSIKETERLLKTADKPELREKRLYRIKEKKYLYEYAENRIKSL